MNLSYLVANSTLYSVRYSTDNAWSSVDHIDVVLQSYRVTTILVLMEEHATKIYRMIPSNVTVHRPLPTYAVKPVCSHVTCLL